MPIIDIQRRIREVGRIRLGVQKVSQRTGKLYPAKLEQFRLTSTDRQAIEAAADIYGGTCQQWKEAPGHGKQWEVYTERDSMAVLVPPATDQLGIDQLFSQWFEQWEGGGCLHRCDGVWDHLQGADCSCDPEDRACDPYTRVKVILRELPGFGTWRLESHGWNAAVELAASVELLALAAAKGYALPARLRMEPRSQRIPGEPERQFMVPVIDVDVTIERLGLVQGTPPLGELGGAPQPGSKAPALPAGVQPSPGEQAFIDVMPTPAEQVATQTTAFDGLQDRPPPRAAPLPDPEAPFTADEAPIEAPVVAPRPQQDVREMIREHAKAAAKLEGEALDALTHLMYACPVSQLTAGQVGIVRWTLDMINVGRLRYEYYSKEGGGLVTSPDDDTELEFEPVTGEWVPADGPPTVPVATLQLVSDAPEEAPGPPQPPPAAPPAPPVGGSSAPTEKGAWREAARVKGLRVSTLLRKAKELCEGPPPGSYEELGALEDADREKVWAWLASQ